MALHNNIEPFAVGLLNANKYDDIGYKIACGLLHQAEYMPISISPDDYYAGYYDEEAYGVRFHFANSILLDEKILEKEMKENPVWNEELAFIHEKICQLDSSKLVYEEKTDLEKKLTNMKVCWGGDWGGHSNPDYDMFLKLGTTGIKKKIEYYKKENPERNVFYESLMISLEAIERLAERYSLLAQRKSLYADEKERVQLERIASCLWHCPKNPPRNFFEACQMFWLCFSFDGIDSPGRFDQYMIDYYRLSDKEDAKRDLEHLWELFYKTRTWNLCISGSDIQGNDETNELSYLILQTARKYKYTTPNLTMRVHKKTPEKLIREAIKTYAAGVGMPALYNDEIVCKSLERIGIPQSDAHEYCMNGCNQIDIMGKSHMGLEDGEVSLFKCLELTLFRGKCQYCHENIGIDVGMHEKWMCFEDVMDAFKKEMEYVIDQAVAMSNKAQELYAKIAPNPLRSCLIQGCIEKGIDYKNGGPLYNHGQILAEGIADTADALAAIKYFIYEKKKYTFSELICALQNDFDGYRSLYKDFSSFKKFGNDDDYVDLIAVDIVTHYMKYLQTKKTYRGGIFTGGCSPFNRAASYGEKISAMPNGKRVKDTNLADSIGAVPGEDIKGVTALMNSVLKYDHSLAGSGFILNLKFNKTIFEHERGYLAVESLIKAFFESGGQQLSPMVIDRKELEDALIHPEKHKNLIVRVGGYSDYFVNLSPELQQNVIKRTYLEI